MFERWLGRIARALDEAGFPYMVIGGQAVLLHGEPRLTRDIDVTLGVSLDRLESVVDVAARPPWGLPVRPASQTSGVGVPHKRKERLGPPGRLSLGDLSRRERPIAGVGWAPPTILSPAGRESLLLPPKTLAKNDWLGAPFFGIPPRLDEPVKG